LKRVKKLNEASKLEEAMELEEVRRLNLEAPRVMIEE
jgi:hypothetical protein